MRTLQVLFISPYNMSNEVRILHPLFYSQRMNSRKRYSVVPRAYLEVQATMKIYVSEWKGHGCRRGFFKQEKDLAEEGMCIATSPQAAFFISTKAKEVFRHSTWEWLSRLGLARHK